MANSAEPVRIALRKLWSDHVFWTREYILEAIDGTPDANAAATRLLRNQEDIGEAIVPYYGKDGGSRLTQLLKEHVLIAVDLVAAAKSGDQKEFAKHDARWSNNAGDISHFLSSANPHWPEKDVMDLLAQHLKLTKEETVAQLQGDFETSVKRFDDIFNEIMVLADALYDGLVAQFPDRFKSAVAV